MTQEEFWQLIKLVDQDALEQQDEEAALAALEAALADKSIPEIESFYTHLAHALYDIDGETYADNAGDSGGSDDAFLYARCYVVARGRDFYNSVKGDPGKMPQTIEQWCESLLYVAPNAWGRITGSEPNEWEFYPDVSFETGYNTSQWS